MDLKETLLGYLQELKVGNAVTLGTSTTDGNEVPIKWIEFSNETGFVLRKVQCLRSAKFGLGDCACKTHPAEMSGFVDTDHVLEMLVANAAAGDHVEAALRKAKAKMALRNLNDIITNL